VRAIDFGNKRNFRIIYNTFRRSSLKKKKKKRKKKKKKEKKKDDHLKFTKKRTGSFQVHLNWIISINYNGEIFLFF
jgi:hypothetical protein